MKKNLIKLMSAVFVIVSCVGLTTLFSPNVEAKEAPKEYTYFDRTAPAGIDPCTTGGTSVCYIN
ncbi:MAG: hypothetical protein ACK5HT_13175 [Draconibacterium sp.]